MADTVAVMRDGRIVQHAPPDEVYRRPADLWVAGFVGSANVLGGTVVEGRRVQCALGVLDMAAGPVGGPVDVVVRPAQVQIVGEGGVPATVEDRRYFGHDALVRLGLADGGSVLARVSSDGSAPAGTTVSARCRGPVLCFPRKEADGAPDR